MAFYTETLQEYLMNGNELPEVFDEIEGFEDLFIAYFIDQELGFETEELFKIKLELYANLYVPIYKERISDLASALVEARTPIKTYYEKNDLTITMGEQNSDSTILPINTSTAKPNQLAHSEEYENENNAEINREEKGYTPTEIYMVIEKLNGKVKVLTLELLKEFLPIFMNVY